MRTTLKQKLYKRKTNAFKTYVEGKAVGGQVHHKVLAIDLSTSQC